MIGKNQNQTDATQAVERRQMFLARVHRVLLNGERAHYKSLLTRVLAGVTAKVREIALLESRLAVCLQACF